MNSAANRPLVDPPTWSLGAPDLPIRRLSLGWRWATRKASFNFAQVELHRCGHLLVAAFRIYM
jgi:hypothetical protein